MRNRLNFESEAEGIVVEQNQQSKDPLHGVTLEEILKALVKFYGWEILGQKIRIKCFNLDPSISSSLTFLRKTPWARKKVETLYLRSLKKIKASM